jgi:hypothetical protein
MDPPYFVFALAVAVARSFVVIPQHSGGICGCTAVAVASAVAFARSFVVIPQRSGGICDYLASHNPSSFRPKQFTASP